MSVAADGTDIRTLGTGVPLDWRVVPVGAPKFPNLVQRPPSHLVVSRSDNGHWLLGFTSMVDNRGPGIIWIRGTRAPGVHVMQVWQLLQLASGSVRVDPSSGELHYVVAPPHYHWHFLGFEHYELRSADDFRLRAVDHKSGFCIADHWGHAIGVKPGPPRFLDNCDQFEPKATFVEEGSSVGYTDRIPRSSTASSSTSRSCPPGATGSSTARTRTSICARAAHSDNAASLLVRLTWRDGAPSATPVRVCHTERC